MAYLQFSPLGSSRDEIWRGQVIRTRSVSWNFHVCGNVNRHGVRRRPPVSRLTLNGKDIPFVNSIKYLGVRKLHGDYTYK
jgi:hypothetical protein